MRQSGSRANQPVRGSPVSHTRPPPHSLSRSAAQPCAAQPPAITRSQTQAPTRGRGGPARSPVRGRSPPAPAASSTCSSPLRSRKPAQAARAASPGGPGRAVGHHSHTCMPSVYLPHTLRSAIQPASSSAQHWLLPASARPSSRAASA